MMYVHYCTNCNRIHVLNGHKVSCPACHSSLTELEVNYLDYLSYNSMERRLLTELCANEASLNELRVTYRMYKYSKWYRPLPAAATVV